MKEVVKITKDKANLLWLEIDDDVNNYELLGILSMMVKRVERNILHGEGVKVVSPMPQLEKSSTNAS